MIAAPVWTQTATPQRETVPVPARADVAIIGAGITGLSAAIALRKLGATVAVFDVTAGAGASSRNGGMVLTGLKLSPETLLARYGAERARAMFDASLEAINLVEALLSEYAISCGFARTGHIELASKPAHVRHFAGLAKLLEDTFGHRVRVLARGELAAEVGSAAFYGGLLDERSAAVDPMRYVDGLARAATERGATLCERAEATAVRRDERGWRVETSRGETATAHLVVATGAYTGAPFPRLRERLVNVGSYVIATAPLPTDLATSLLPRGRMAFDSKRLLHYFRLTPDDRFLFGGRAAFVPESRNAVAQSARILRGDMIAAFPQLRDVAVEFAWGGTLDVTFDLMPHCGQVDGMHYAAGYAGHGVALATLLGTLLAREIVDGPQRHPFAAPLPKPPLATLATQRLALPLVGLWQRVLDAVS